MKPQVRTVADKGYVQMTATFCPVNNFRLPLGSGRIPEVYAFNLKVQLKKRENESIKNGCYNLEHNTKQYFGAVKVDSMIYVLQAW